MPYRYLEDVATADAAFEAWGTSLEETFRAAADAAMNVMVDDLGSIAARERRTLRVEAESPEMLLFELLQELVFRKDAERLLLRVKAVKIDEGHGGWSLAAETLGETIDPGRHDLAVDVKAVTLHRFGLIREESGWRATVVLDV